VNECTPLRAGGRVVVVHARSTEPERLLGVAAAASDSLSAAESAAAAAVAEAAEPEAAGPAAAAEAARRFDVVFHELFGVFASSEGGASHTFPRGLHSFTLELNLSNSRTHS